MKNDTKEVLQALPLIYGGYAVIVVASAIVVTLLTGADIQDAVAATGAILLVSLVAGALAAYFTLELMRAKRK